MKLIYSKQKIFYFKRKIDSLLPGNKTILPPIHIRIKPTNLCNHNCLYCAYKNRNLQLGKNMLRENVIPRKKMLEILSDLHDIGVKAITFSGGGDPLCYPHITEALKMLVKYKIKFAALTNASLLYGETAEIFAAKGTWLRISIDGWDEKSYSKYRNVSNDEFKKVMGNINNFIKLGGKCRLGMCMVIDRHNAAHIFEFSKKLRGMGVDSMKISPVIISNRGDENNRYHASIYNKVKDQIGTAKKCLKGIEIYDAYHKFDPIFKKDYKWCPYIQILPVIGADLNIYSCQDKAYNLKNGYIGSIKNKKFKDFWFSDKNNFFKINPSKDCSHHCVADNKNKLLFEFINADKEHLEFV